MGPAAHTTITTEQKNRAFWLKHLHQWHWVSAAGCLVGLILFAITGFTLNHANAIAGKPVVTTTQQQLPPALLEQLQAAAKDETSHAVPRDVRRWLSQQMSVPAGDDRAEWSPDELYFSLPRPGGDAWLTIDLQSGEVTHEVTTRGWIAYLNDLHKGRNTGGAWSLFIDVFSFCVLIFAITGLLLLKMHSTHRPATWPMVALGLVLPLVLAILFIH
jgi:hypothetical protein